MSTAIDTSVERSPGPPSTSTPGMLEFKDNIRDEVALERERKTMAPLPRRNVNRQQKFSIYEAPGRILAVRQHHCTITTKLRGIHCAPAVNHAPVRPMHNADLVHTTAQLTNSRIEHVGGQTTIEDNRKTFPGRCETMAMTTLRANPGHVQRNTRIGAPDTVGLAYGVTDLSAHPVTADLYLQASTPATETASNFTLLRLTERPHPPQCVGTATISRQPTNTVNTQQFSVRHAVHWTTQHTIDRRDGAHNNLKMRYPMAAPATTRAEATRTLTADTINPRAPRPSDTGATDQSRPRLTLFTTQRDPARNILCNNAARQLAAAGPATDAGPATARGAAPSWDYTLTHGGAHTP